jgi:hypothetical protein
LSGNCIAARNITGFVIRDIEYISRQGNHINRKMCSGRPNQNPVWGFT